MSVESRIGTEIAGYRIERLLGRGGMGVVYLAEHTRLRRKAALKILASDLATDEKFRRRFIRESELAASIDHPNIIQIYDAADAEGQLYIAMRYVDGVDLAALLDVEGALEFARTISILSQVGDALDAAHLEGLVHRDVKPANILIAPGQERDHVFLSDFGLTKRGASESHLTASGEMLGTIDYMAPEQIEGKPTDGRADLYSLGCVAFECLTGHKPYGRDSDAAVLWAHMTAPVPSVSDFRDLPEGAGQVVTRALAKAPDDRFSTCREFVTALQDELPETEGAMPAFVRARRRRRGLARLVWSWPGRVAAALLVIALGLGVFLVLRPSSTPIDLKAMANVLASLDPISGSIQKAFRVGAAPSAAAAVGSTIWVANKDDGAVQKVDPADGRVTTAGATTRPVAMAIGEGFAWVLGGFPTSIVYSFPIGTGSNGAPIDLGTNSEDIAAGLGSVWVTDLNHRALLKIDPQSHERTPIEMDGIPTGVAVDTHSVWVTVDGGPKNELLRIDPTSEAITRIELKMRANSVAAGPAGVWVTNGDDDSVTRIDPATNEVKSTVRVGQEPVDVALGDGAVWVAAQQGQRVSRVDAATGKVTSTGPMSLYPSSVAAGAEGVWVTANTNVLSVPFNSTNCTDEIPVTDTSVTCALFTVPERHTDPGGRTIQIWVAKMPTAATNPSPDPVVVVGADLGEHPDYAGSTPLRARTGRDVYNVDLRGVGNSRPSLTCPEVERVKATLLGLRLRAPSARHVFLRAVTRCHDRLVSQSVDLGAYNIKEAAADVEDLRRALGFPRWNLRALGYSSRVTFEVLRDFPSGVRAAWFDSPQYPQDNFFDQAIPSTDGALTVLANVCVADTTCNKHFPDIKEAFSRAVTKLNTHPVSVTVRDQAITGGKPVKVIIDGDALVRQVRQDLATAGAIPLLPAHIYAASLERIGSDADSMAANLVARPTLCSGFRARCRPPLTFSLGTALSMLCHDEAPFAMAQPAAPDPVYGEDFNQNPYLAACAVWNVGAAAPSTREPVNSDIPVLIFHGQFDPYYPYSTARTGAQGLGRNFLYEGTGEGYNSLGVPCLLAIRNQWINDPTKAPDVSCLSTLPKTATGSFELRVTSY
jgi:YVTN family beta-propeller protein